MNIINSTYTKGDNNVFLCYNELEYFLARPNTTKDKLGMFNYWNEKKRSNFTEDATCSKLVLDYDQGTTLKEVIDIFKDNEYIYYYSTGNNRQTGEERFRFIVSLKEPVLAYDLKYYKKQSKFLEFFKNVDDSTFAVGRYFYRPSRYDKGGEHVEVVYHQGELFDFYSRWPKIRHLEKFDILKARLQQQEFQKKRQTFGNAHLDWFTEWFNRKYPSGVHYPDGPAVVLMAKKYNVDLHDAMSMFRNNYQGHSDWEKNFLNLWNSNYI